MKKFVIPYSLSFHPHRKLEVQYNPTDVKRICKSRLRDVSDEDSSYFQPTEENQDELGILREAMNKSLKPFFTSDCVRYLISAEWWREWCDY